MKPTVVLIHGFPLSSAMWEPQTKGLKAAGYRVFTPDLPGFGNSRPKSQESCSMESFADEIFSLIKRQAGGSAVVGGFSMGGYVLLALLRDHPEAVSAAMFIDTHPAADTPETRTNRLAMVETVRKQGVAPIAESMPEKLLSKSASPELMQEVAEMIRRQPPQAIIAAQLAMAARRDQTDLLGKLRIPTLVIVGSDDVITPPATAAALSGRIPFSRLVEIPSAGHLSSLQSPEMLNNAMLEFLNSLPALHHV
ncbi:MAG TPA: alpha/beta fold hydrolase [Phycisphaerae bacterium]|nr:alpha/beta fold hydrolase [Phycisphaerae bacterium]